MIRPSGDNASRAPITSDYQRRSIALLAEMVGAYHRALRDQQITGELQHTLVQSWHDRYLAALVAPTSTEPRPLPLPDVENVAET